MRGVSRSIAFTGNDLDRQSDRRSDAAWIDERLASREARFVAFVDLNPLVTVGADPAIAYLSNEELSELGGPSEPVFLGMREAVPIFACEIRDSVPRAWQGRAAFADLRAVASALSPQESGLVAQGRSLLDWNRKVRFCSTCGAPMVRANAGHLRSCSSDGCRAEQFPRLDVVVITLVTTADGCLLGRQPRFAPGLFSCFAGFVEPGETAEAAARREVREEAGVELQALTYAVSQPWPFPSSITLAFIGQTADRSSARAGSEINEVRWFSPAEARGMVNRADSGTKEGLRVPGPMTLGNQLVRRWLAEISGGPDGLPAR